MNLEVNSSCQERACVIEVSGEVDVSNAENLRSVVDKLLAEGSKSLLIDMTNTPYIDSTGIGVLMGAAHKAQSCGAHLSIVCPNDNILRVFEMLGVTSKIEVKKQR